MLSHPFLHYLFNGFILTFPVPKQICNAAYKSFTVLFSQQLYEIGEAEWKRLDQGHPGSFTVDHYPLVDSNHYTTLALDFNFNISWISISARAVVFKLFHATTLITNETGDPPLIPLFF